MITAEELGERFAFPGSAGYGMNLRTWLAGKALEGLLASGRNFLGLGLEGRLELLDAINHIVDDILTDLAKRVPEKKPVPIPKA